MLGQGIFLASSFTFLRASCMYEFVSLLHMYICVSWALLGSSSVCLLCSILVILLVLFYFNNL